MIAIVGDTPYQLMSALLVAGEIAPDEQIVFFINTYLYFEEQKFHYSDAHEKVADILYYGRKHMGAGKLFAGLLNPQSMLKHIEGYKRDMDITAVICSRTTYMATYLYNAYAKRRHSLPVYLVEEGIGEYTGPMEDTRFTKACRMLGRKTHMDQVTCAYFAAPELYPYKTAFPVEKTPHMGDNTRNLIESFFNMNDILKTGNPLEKYHCILLSNPNSANMKNTRDAQLCDQADSDIMDAVAEAAEGDIIIKVHPIDPGFKKEGIETYYSQLPMELLLLSMDCDNKIFVSTLSTAMLTPKLLFNKQPFLVFAYKLVDEHTAKYLPGQAQRQKYYDFIEGVMAEYDDKTRCATPETMDELREVVRAFYARTGNVKS